MNTIRTTTFCAAVMLLTVPAGADWFPGESYKMHAPQLPDPNGWDVAFRINTSPITLADDWLCTESGSVDDIHIWLSFQGDRPPALSPTLIVEGSVFIMSNVPAGVDGIYSHPGELLWWTAIQTSEVDLRKPNAELIPYGTGIQGWFVPDPVSTIPILADHRNYYQLNINPANDGETIPFVQQKGQVYWLGANLWAHDDGPNGGVYELGWKTSLTQYFDAAAYSGPTFMQEWNVLSDPVNGKLLDLAFVITSVPEPATLVLTVLGGLVAIVSRRRVSL